MWSRRVGFGFLAVAAAFWFAFDRVWPRIPPGLFVQLELWLLLAAGIGGALAIRRDRSVGTLALVGGAIGGLSLWFAVALLHLRYTP